MWEEIGICRFGWDLGNWQPWLRILVNQFLFCKIIYYNIYILTIYTLLYVSKNNMPENIDFVSCRILWLRRVTHSLRSKCSQTVFSYELFNFIDFWTRNPMVIISRSPNLTLTLKWPQIHSFCIITRKNVILFLMVIFRDCL